MDYEKANMATRYEREIPEGYEARIEGNKVIIEIKESEDERVRKVISLALIASEDELSDFYKVHNIHRKECTDWLERQKEPLTPEEKMKHPLYIEGFEAGKQVGAQYEAVFGKQKEQKPEEVNVKALLTADRLASAEMTGRPKERSEIINNPEKYGLQKPAEWSGEDITNGWIGVDLERYLSCLQRLGTGNPQQPGTINSKWFKEHCRPQSHWRPSEEQMEWLKDVIETVPMTCRQQVSLESIYANLQKLL